MYITSREKSIIDLIVKTAGKHTVHSLSAYLNVSVRTIQRDLKSVEKILKHFELELKRTSDDGLIINGKNEHIYKLIQNLIDVNPTDETPKERKLQLLIKLFHEGESFKIQVLSKQLGVSITTITAYLDDLTQWLNQFNITLTRKKGVGVEIHGHETNIRKALANYFIVHFHEEIIESLYFLQMGNTVKGPVLGYFSPKYLVLVEELINKYIIHRQTRLADHDYIGLIIHTCITLQRTENKFLIQEEGNDSNRFSTEFQLIQKLCEQLEKDLNIPLKEQDLQFLTVVLRGSKLHDADKIDYDSILLGKFIKHLIQDVSSQLNIDLTKDFSLFQGLLAHMEPSIFRLKQQMGLFNPLTGEIKNKYPVLFMAVKESLEKIFKDIIFPDDEVAFIVLHFGSALLMSEEKVNIHAVVVCPTGIGTSKMLASRIKKEISEIYSIEIKSIKDFEKANPKDYDLIISTVRLPYADLDYILVTPLLNDEDIDKIHSFLKQSLKKITKVRDYEQQIDHKEIVTSNSTLNFKELLQEIKDVQTSMEKILNNFRVYRMKNGSDHFQIIEKMIEYTVQDNIVTDAQSVYRSLKAREQKGGLGIPNTNMALFHCRDEHINQLIFQISHLEEPCIVRGMDGKKIQMKNLLLMLAPLRLTVREQEILSLISTSLIENDIAMMIFSSSNEELIRKKIEDVFLDYLQTNLIKE